jgi:hypothetical protein
MSNWHYRKQQGDAGLNRKPPRLKDLGEHSINIFVREVIQNNLDAVEGDKPITVEFKIHKWNKSKIESFFKFVGKEHIENIRKSAINADPSVSPYLKDCLEVIQGKRDSCFSVVVEETNCIGLLGPVRESGSERSHFDALMRKVEDNNAKKETTNTGGTWGKGSSIFTYTSMLWTWFSYSKLSTPWFDSNNNIKHRTRFIGRSMLAPFFDEEENESILGDAWFCDTEKLRTEKIDAYPFINDKADKFAHELGLETREDDGTTFVVPFFNPVYENDNEVNLESLKHELKSEVVKNWFIPIYNNNLHVCITTDSGTISIDKNYLDEVDELKYKLQILEWYDEGCPVGDKRFVKKHIEIQIPGLKEDYLNKRTKFAKTKCKVKADLIIRILDEDEDFDDEWETVNKVALCRNKGMIVDNEHVIDHKSVRTESILFCGLMSRSENIDNKKQHFDLFLAYSENPAHNTWCRQASDYDRCFLDRFKGKSPKPEKSIRVLFNEVFSVFHKLFEAGKVDQGSKEICSIFRKLAKINVGGGDSDGKAQFFMRSMSNEIDSEGRYVFKKKFISNSEQNDVDVFFRSYISSLEGEKNKGFELLGIKNFSEIEILTPDYNLIDRGESPSFILSPSEDKVVVIRTCKIDDNPAFKNLEPYIKAFAKTPVK